MSKKIRKNITLTADTLKIAEESSKKMDDGNVSGYIRRLIRQDMLNSKKEK